jgi:hypothetical protein
MSVIELKVFLCDAIPTLPVGLQGVLGKRKAENQKLLVSFLFMENTQ